MIGSSSATPSRSNGTAIWEVMLPYSRFQEAPPDGPSSAASSSSPGLIRWVASTFARRRVNSWAFAASERSTSASTSSPPIQAVSRIESFSRVTPSSRSSDWRAWASLSRESAVTRQVT